MEFFIPDIPLHLTATSLKRGFTAILHSPPIAAPVAPNEQPMNFSVTCWKFRSRYSEEMVQQGKIRVPCPDTAARFRARYIASPTTELTIEGWRLPLKDSNSKISTAEFKSLLDTPFISVEAEEKKRITEKEMSVPVELERVATARLWGSQVQCEWETTADEHTRMQVTLLVMGDKREVEIIVGLSEAEDDYTMSNPTTISIPFNSIASIHSIVQTSDILLSLSRPPILTSLNPSSFDPFDDDDSPLLPQRQRQSTLPGYPSHAPMLHFLLTFSSHYTRKQFTERIPRTRLPKVEEVHQNSLPIARIDGEGQAIKEADERGLEEYLKSCDVRTGFQIELMRRNGVLDVSQLLFLKDEIRILESELGAGEAEGVLSRFATKLVRSLGVLGDSSAWEKWGDEDDWEEEKIKVRNHDLARLEAEEARTFGHLETDHRTTGSSNTDLLLLLNRLKHTAAETALSNPSQPRHQLKSGEAFTRLVILTPTSAFLSGPSIDESNSVLRKFASHEHNFLRVTLRDEDIGKYRAGADKSVDLKEFLKERYQGAFAEGLKLAGRNFEFLGYSQSALKEHSAWFVAPFEYKNADDFDVRITAQNIRNSLGDFTNVINIPARWLARVAQAFSSSKPSVSLARNQIKVVDDIKRNGSCFTDGVGTISPALAREVERALTKGMSQAGKRRRGKPTAYQIRLGGSKGIAGIDPTLQGSIICLRPSMIKFDAPDSLTLDIAGTFNKPLPAYLNRPLIKLLEDLEIPSNIFIKLQRDAVREVERARKDCVGAARLLERHGIGNTSGFSSALLKVKSLFEIKSIGDEVDGGGLTDAFVKECIDLAVIHALRDLKYKSRIPLRDSYNLVGIADETPGGYLQEGEIYAAVKEPGGVTKWLEGPVAISRSPVIHPGDLQVVKAVGRLPDGAAPHLSVHTNTIIFSIRGERSLSSCLAGGDLDGDLFLLITSPALIPSTSLLYPPASYDPPEMVKLDRPCTIEDGAEFFLNFVLSDITGLVANRHLHIADQAPNGVFHEDCLKLASIHSDSVDYPKTGKPVTIRSLPKAPSHQRPDFMSNDGPQGSHNNAYESPKILGQLFRDIPLRDVQPRSFVPPVNPASQSLDPDRAITTSINTTPLRYFPHGLGAAEVTQALRDVVMQHLESYSDDLLRICRQNTFARRADRHLSEAEAFVGTITEGGKMVRMKKEVVDKLRIQTESLFASYRDVIVGGEGSDKRDQASRAYAAWSVALEADQTHFGVKSFAWLSMGALLDIMQELVSLDVEEIVID